MKLTRREFVKSTAIGTAGILAYKAALRSAYAFYQSKGIPLFGTSLRGVGPSGIPVAAPDSFAAPVTGVAHYTMDIRQFADDGVCPVLGPTTLWGYNPVNPLGGGFQPQRHLAGILVAQKGVPIQITFRNNLNVAKHILPVDATQVLSDESLVNRTAVHLHGGLVPWVSDGGPFDWFNFQGQHGLSFLNNQVLNPDAPKNCAEYYYPLNQSARFMWYHDHAHGITRLNAYAGLASGMLIRDTFEAGLINQGLPQFVEDDGNEIPLVFQDKIFVGPDILSADHPWINEVQPAATQPGSLWYAHTYDPSRWDVYPGALKLPEPSAVAEFFGDTMLVNGTVYPQVTVQARRYRLRLLNACNARFLNLQLYVADNSPNGITLDTNGRPTNAPFVNAATGKSTFLQIGTEGGFLANPAEIPCSQPFTFLAMPDPITGQTDPSKVLKSLLVAPAERPDLIVDFSKYRPGDSIILYSDAPAPFPSGDDRNDYFPGYNLGSGEGGVGNPANTAHDGFGPNSRVLMRFNLVAATTPKDTRLAINTRTRMPGLDPFIIDPAVLATGVPAPPGIDKRFLSLNEYFDPYGRLIQILGNGAAIYGSPYVGSDSYYLYPNTSGLKTVGATSEYVQSGTTEVWEIYNTTGDVHPMHFHLVNVQVINRQLFDVANLAFASLTGPVIPPEPNELGWKETVPMYPGTVTRIIMKFDVSQAQIVDNNGNLVKSTPESPRTGGHEYVWHCHILEHEEHDMMHALIVT